jgi:hypothetical protein
LPFDITIREWAEQGMIQLEYVDTKSQKADILTKPLPGPAHAACVQGIGLARPRKEEKDAVGLYMVEEVGGDPLPGRISAQRLQGSMSSGGTIDLEGECQLARADATVASITA